MGDLKLASTIAIGSIATDNIINAAEATGTFTITGTLNSSLNSDERIVVTIGGKTYTSSNGGTGGGIVINGSTWSVTVAADEVPNLPSSSGEAVAVLQNYYRYWGGFRWVEGYDTEYTARANYTVDKLAPSITTGAEHSVAEGQVFVSDLTVSGATSLSLSGNDAGKFNIVNGKLVFLQAQDYEGTQKIFSVTVEARDAAGNLTTKAMTVNLTNVVPEITSAATWTLPENETGVTVATLVAQDPGTASATLNYAITGGADSSLFKIEGDKLIYTGVPLDFEKPGQQKTFTVQVTASDGTGNSVPQTITIDLGNVNDNAPVIDMSASYDVAENQVVVATLAAKDPDDTASVISQKTYSVVGGADGALFTVNENGQLVFINAPDYEGAQKSFVVVVRVSDGVYSTTKTLTVNLTDANDAPTAIALSASTVVENDKGAVIGTLSTTDQDQGDTHTYTVDDERFEIVNGQLKLKAGQWINYETDPTVTVEVTSSDGRGGQFKQSFTIDVTDVNDVAPVITSGATWTLAEGQNNVDLVTLTGTDADTHSSLLTYKITGGADAALFEIQNGKLVYVGGALDYDAEGQNKALKVEVTAYDDVNNESTPQLITVNLQDLNDSAPEITSGGTGTLLENQNNHVVATLTSHDKDQTGETVTYTITGGADAGLFKIEDNKLVYIGGPLDFEYADQQKSFTVTVVASDGVNTGAAQEITVSLKDVNDNAPEIDMADSYEAAENQTVVTTLVAKDADTADAAVKTFEVSGGVDGHLFTVNEKGELVFINAPDYEGNQKSFVVEVKLTDGNYVVKKTLTVNLTDVNEAPTVVTLGNQVTQTAENGEAMKVADITVTDDALGTETLTLTGADAAFFELRGTELWFKGGANFEAKSSYAVAVVAADDDEAGSATSETFTLTITNVNDAPTAVSLTNLTVVENAAGAIIGQLSTTDQDVLDTFTYTVSDDRFEVDALGNLKLRSNIHLDTEKEPTVTLTVTSKDPGGLTASQSFTINVLDQNDNAPVLTTATVDLKENVNGLNDVTGVFIANLLAADPDTVGGPVQFALLQSADSSLFRIEEGKLYYVGAPIDFEKADRTEFSIKVSVTDGAYTTTGTITVNLKDVNDNAPLLETEASYDVDENQTFVADLRAAVNDQGLDPDDVYEFTLKGDDANLFTVVDGKLVFKSAPNYEAGKTEYQIEVEVSDGKYTVTKPVTINVKDVNEAPTSITLNYELAHLTTTENGAAMKVSDINVTDDDLGNNTLDLVGADAGMFYIHNGNELWFNGNADYETQRAYSVAVKVSDGQNSLTSEVITVDVTDVNDNAPEVDATVYDLAENATNVVVADLSSLDPDTIGFNPAQFSLPEELTGYFEINADNQLVYIGPALDFEELDFSEGEVPVYASDGVNTTTAYVKIRIRDVNETPTAIALAANTVAENAAGAVIGKLSTTDQDAGDAFTYTVSDSRFEVVNGQLKLKAGVSLDFEAASKVNVTVTSKDAGGLTTDETFTINVTDVNETPSKVVVNGGSVLENSANGTTVATLSALDQDAGDTFRFDLLNNADGRFVLSGNSILVADSLRLDYEQAASHQVVVRVTDSANNSYDEILTLGVGDVVEERVTGAASADQIYGGVGNDFISTGAGNDVILGGAGRDKINGGSGNDRIDGGSGRDTMTGGSGRDVFIFNDKDTGKNRGTADYITDFNGRSGDKISLRAMDAMTTKKGNQNFSFIGTDAFTKAGQVRYEKMNGFTFVYLNTDNDQAAEGVIKLKGMLDMQKQWFVL